MELNSFLITFKLLKNLSSHIPNTLISEKSYQNLNIREKCFVWLYLLFYFLISSMFPSCTIRLLLTDFTRVYGRPTYIWRIYKMRGSGTERTTRCLKHLLLDADYNHPWKYYGFPELRKRFQIIYSFCSLPTTATTIAAINEFLYESITITLEISTAFFFSIYSLWTLTLYAN